jgi:hypothetical protein
LGVASRVSDGIFIGDTRGTKDYELVDHLYVVIEKLIMSDRFPSFVLECLDWEDIKDLNCIFDGMVGKLGC